MTKDALQPDNGEPDIDVGTLPEAVEHALAARTEHSFYNGRLVKEIQALGARQIIDPESPTVTMYDTRDLHPHAKETIAELLTPHLDQLTLLATLNPNMPTPNIIELRGKQPSFSRPTNILYVELAVRNGQAIPNEPTRIQLYREPVTYSQRR